MRGGEKGGDGEKGREKERAPDRFIKPVPAVRARARRRPPTRPSRGDNRGKSMQQRRHTRHSSGLLAGPFTPNGLPWREEPQRYGLRDTHDVYRPTDFDRPMFAEQEEAEEKEEEEAVGSISRVHRRNVSISARKFSEAYKLEMKAKTERARGYGERRRREAVVTAIYSGSHHDSSWLCGKRAHLDLRGREVRAATSCSLPKAHKIPGFIYAHMHPSVAGSQTVCFDPCFDPFMNERSGCGPVGAQRDRPRAAAKPCRATISSHTLTSEASQHQNHWSVTTPRGTTVVPLRPLAPHSSAASSALELMQASNCDLSGYHPPDPAAATPLSANPPQPPHPWITFVHLPATPMEHMTRLNEKWTRFKKY
ncbi:unnamed protein product [Pleuronectes platessa]|uniref:Uncharacterized protein n=1 Tax=Pleuronectes platessa TaxID=8262 RepID=A0A9N7TTG4_PLEPL|nr:unnamed protein product [Pleuronectes platessa]